MDARGGGGAAAAGDLGFGGGVDGSAAATTQSQQPHHRHPTSTSTDPSQATLPYNPPASPSVASPRLSAPMMAVGSSSNPPPSYQSGDGKEEAQWSLKDIYWQGRECKIITQNQNGPCSLIALCNILLLRGEIEITPPDRPVVSYSYLSQLLAEHLLTNSNAADEPGGLEAALSTLPRTQSGLDVDVGFESIRSFSPSARGSDGGGELSLFKLCNVPLVHGWLPDPADPETYKAVTAAGSYNKATDLVVKGDEIADGAVVRDRQAGTLAAALTRESAQSSGKRPERNGWSDEQRVAVRQALALQAFLDSQSTQLTYHGLFVLAQELPAGQPVALFRNSHLSVLYRRLPEEGVESAAENGLAPPPTLFTLVTDSSFLMEDEIVWESLVDVDGASSEFYDGKFRKSSLRQGDYVGRGADGPGDEERQVHQANEDADYALAMQIYQNDQERLQDQQRRRDQRRSQSGTHARSRQEARQGRNGLRAGAAGPDMPAPAHVPETPREVFTTMRYEVEPSSAEGDALVISSLIPTRLRNENEALLADLQGLSMGGGHTGAQEQSTNPFSSAAESVVGAAPSSTSKNPFLNSETRTHGLFRHIPLLAQHLERLKTSAGAICRAYPSVWSMASLEREHSLEPERILEAIESCLASSSGDSADGGVMGIRVAIQKDGSIRVTQRSVSAFPSTLEDGVDSPLPSVRLDVVPTRVRTMDLEPLVFNKTDARGFYEAAKQRVGADASVLSGLRATDQRCFDVVLWNDEQMDTLEGPSAGSTPTRMVTESSLANVVVELVVADGGGSRFVTPRTSIGLLDGLLRRWMVDKGVVEEEEVEVDELVRRLREGTARLWLCNSLRGVWEVELAEGAGLGAASSANAANKGKKARFSSIIQSYSRGNSSGDMAPPAEQVHKQVADDLYGHKQTKSKGRKAKKAKDDKKDCIVM